MFEPLDPHPRVFGQPLGTDFAKSVVSGLKQRQLDHEPEQMARVTLIVNTSRMARRIKSLFLENAPGFLPRILLLSHIETLLPHSAPELPRPAIQRRLQLAQLIAPVLKDYPELGSQNSLFALVDSLASLLDEMQGEGVDVDTVSNLDVSDQSGHWQNAQTLIKIAYEYAVSIETGQDAEARQRQITLDLIAHWSLHPPRDPIILAGSTGSRGTTATLMTAICELPQGAIILPGFDTSLPHSVWQMLTDPMTGEDHPQYRFARLMQTLNITNSQVREWYRSKPVTKDRNSILSLALRPAPVTDAWLTEGPTLPDINASLTGITLVEAQSQRLEALTIAMRLRKAAEDGQSAALITPDRLLTRQVAAALDRWDIQADDSAGAPLHLSAPGRFLRHIADLMSRQLDAELLLTVLKHPLTQSSDTNPKHGLFTQQLELEIRRTGIPYPDKESLAKAVQLLQSKVSNKTELSTWGDWLISSFTTLPETKHQTLDHWVACHRSLAELIANGSKTGSGGLWDKAAGRSALAVLDELQENSEFSAPLPVHDYHQLMYRSLAQSEVRDRDAPHPDLMIWGTLEARVQGADLVILGGLNEGSWPEAVTADPWLNRTMRRDAGLLLPDRRIGLSAHDFQQAAAAPEVWFTRSLRSDDTETVPSRWINRLTNLMEGLPERNGPKALEKMKGRGLEWIRRAQTLQAVASVPPAKRAAPKPPAISRPRDFSVTEIKTLIRDPYAIYAKHCLQLRQLEPILQEPDAPVRGIVIHKIMESFIQGIMADRELLTTQYLMETTDHVLMQDAPWPTARAMWRARIERIADWIVETESARLERGTPFALEAAARGTLSLPEIGGSIRARADRIDLTDTGEAILYDYKSGSVPTTREQKYFDKQMLLEAAILEAGGFPKIGPKTVLDAVYLGMGTTPKHASAPLDEIPSTAVLKELIDLIREYLDPNQHFLSRRMVRSETDSGAFDHLARHGEWDDTDAPDGDGL
ncbi:MAG: double-strand break repair protein AddB [Paracoccaceae bacterium]